MPNSLFQNLRPTLLALLLLISGVLAIGSWNQAMEPEDWQQAQASSSPAAAATTDLAADSETEIDLWPGLDQLLNELQMAETQASAPNEPQSPSPVVSAEPAASPEPQPTSEPVSLPSLEPLYEASAATWLTSSQEQRLLNSLALLKGIFKAEPEQISTAHVQNLTACIDASAAEDDLGTLKVYELAAACALALGWR